VRSHRLHRRAEAGAQELQPGGQGRRVIVGHGGTPRERFDHRQEVNEMTRLNQDGATLAPRKGDALLLVDVQRDFVPGGALPVPGGDRIVAPLNRWSERFAELGLPVFASFDWHPADHCSFRAQGGPWPPHCVKGSDGARFAAGLRIPYGTEVIYKGTARHLEAYSAFAGTGLAGRLHELGVRRLYIGGLATDWCVKRTVLDALALGFEVVLLTDAIAAVDVEPGAGARAIEAMKEAGAVEAGVEHAAA
jgi:nicotinamidase/pyrazinamidase